MAKLHRCHGLAILLLLAHFCNRKKLSSLFCPAIPKSGDGRATLPAAVARIDEFVMQCEELFDRERDAWLSTSMSAKLSSKASGGPPSSNDEDSKHTPQNNA